MNKKFAFTVVQNVLKKTVKIIANKITNAMIVANNF